MQKRVLLNTRNRDTYFSSVVSQAKSTQKLKRSAIKSFDKFCNSQYHTKNCEGVIEELLKNNSIEQSLDVLQSWINWNVDKRQPNGLRTYFNHLNDYFYYRGIKLDIRDTKTLKFPKKIKRREYPLTLEEIQKIITPAKYKKKTMYLALISSGMRIDEVLRLQRKHLEIGRERVKVTIPGEFTKSGQERITFLSKEAGKYNLQHIRSLDPEDLVWGQNPRWENNVTTEDQNFARLCDNANLGMKYPSGTRMITIYSFRSYFITKGNKVDDFGFGHAIAGHDHYMKNYERYTEEELLELYLNLEPDLFVFDLTKQQEENTTLKRQLREENKEIKEKMNELEREMRLIKKYGKIIPNDS